MGKIAKNMLKQEENKSLKKRKKGIKIRESNWQITNDYRLCK